VRVVRTAQPLSFFFSAAGIFFLVGVGMINSKHLHKALFLPSGRTEQVNRLFFFERTQNSEHESLVLFSNKIPVRGIFSFGSFFFFFSLSYGNYTFVNAADREI